MFLNSINYVQNVHSGQGQYGGVTLHNFTPLAWSTLPQPYHNFTTRIQVAVTRTQIIFVVEPFPLSLALNS